MARPRTGSAWEIRPGVFRVAVTLRPGSSPRRWSRECPPRRDGVPVDERHARAFAAELQRRYDRGEWDPHQTEEPEALPDDPSVLEYIRKWAAAQTYDSAPKDVAIIERYLPRSKLSRLQVRQVSSRDALAFAEWIQTLPSKRGGKLSSRTVHHPYDLLQRAFDRAVLDGLCQSNPFANREVRRALPSKVDKVAGAREAWPWTHDEIERMISAPEIPPDRQLRNALLFLTGMRSGECNALRFRDIEADAKPLGRITIRRAVKSVSRSFGGTKTGAVKRVPIHPALGAILRPWIAQGWAETFGRDPCPDDLVMPSVAGKRVMGPRDEVHANKMFKRDATALGIAPRHQHTARHSFISLALDDGADASHLRWVTHAPPASAFDGYARGQWARLCAEVSKLQVRAPGRGLVEGCRGSGRGFGEGEKPHEKPLKASESGESVEGCRGLFDMTALLSVEKNKVSTAGGEAGGGSAFGSAHAPAEHGAIPDETRDAWRKHRGIEGPPGGTDMVRSGSNWHQVEDTHPPVQAMTGRFATSSAHTEAERCALALLDAVDSGEAVAGALEDLVSSVLALPVVSLALEVREGGRLRVRRGIQLAEEVLRNAVDSSRVGRDYRPR